MLYKKLTKILLNKHHKQMGENLKLRENVICTGQYRILIWFS